MHSQLHPPICQTLLSTKKVYIYTHALAHTYVCVCNCNDILEYTTSNFQNIFDCLSSDLHHNLIHKLGGNEWAAKWSHLAKVAQGIKGRTRTGAGCGWRDLSTSQAQASLLQGKTALCRGYLGVCTELQMDFLSNLTIF